MYVHIPPFFSFDLISANQQNANLVYYILVFRRYLHIEKGTYNEEQLHLRSGQKQAAAMFTIGHGIRRTSNIVSIKTRKKTTTKPPRQSQTLE